MSIELIRTAGRRRKELNLNASDVAVLNNFIAFMIKETSLISESLSNLAKYVGRSKRTVRHSIQSLMDKNLVFRIGDYSPKNHETNVYQINEQALNAAEKKGAL